MVVLSPTPDEVQNKISNEYALTWFKVAYCGAARSHWKLPLVKETCMQRGMKGLPWVCRGGRGPRRAHLCKAKRAPRGLWSPCRPRAQHCE